MGLSARLLCVLPLAASGFTIVKSFERRSAAEASQALLDVLDGYVNQTHYETTEGDMAGFLESLRGPGKSFWDSLVENLRRTVPGFHAGGDWTQVSDALLNSVPPGADKFLKTDMFGTPGAKPIDLVRLFPLAVMSGPALSQSGAIWTAAYDRYAKHSQKHMKDFAAHSPTSVSELDSHINAMQGNILGRYSNFSRDMRHQMVFFGPLMVSAKAFIPQLPDLDGCRKLLNHRFEGSNMMNGLIESGTYYTMSGDPVKLNIDLGDHNRELLESTRMPRELREEQEARAENLIRVNRQLVSKASFVSQWSTALNQFVDMYDAKFRQAMGPLGQPVYMIVGTMFQMLRSIIQNTEKMFHSYADGVHRVTENFGLKWQKPERK